MKAVAIPVLKLIQGAKVFVIPSFQRRYTWKKDQWQQLWDDIIAESQVNHNSDQDALEGHFLGSVVLHPAPGPASTLMRHQVIDGQQRLTTILVLLTAIRDVREGEADFQPESITEQYLQNKYDNVHPDKLVPTKLDRDAFVKTVRNGEPHGDVGMAYNFFRTKLERYRDAGNSLADFQDTLLLRMLIVEINTKVGDSVNAIFNTLNSKGMPLSPADLVRNEILHHIGEDQAEEAYTKYWIPMEKELVNPKAKNQDREFVTFLWAREVAIDPAVSRDNLFSMFEKRLRTILSEESPGMRQRRALEELQRLHRDHKLFLALRDSNKLAHLDAPPGPALSRELKRLSAWKAEPATPIGFWVLRAAVDEKITDEEAARTIHVLLSFLVKRILNGTPTNQLNRLLTPIASDLNKESCKKVDPSDRIRQILSQKGYYWPLDSQVRSNVESTPIYVSAKRYAKFLLGTAEAGTSGYETADLKNTQLEHIIPQSLPDHWRDYIEQFGGDIAEAEAVLHTLGNLTLTESNQKMGNQSFDRKKDEFFVNSAIRLNREIGQNSTFTAEDVKDRGRQLVERILSVYDFEPLGKNEERSHAQDESSLVERLRSLLERLEVDSYVRDETLVSILGAKLVDVRKGVSTLDPTLARLVRDKGGAIPDWFPEALKNSVSEQLKVQGANSTWSEVATAELLQLNSEVDHSGDEDEGVG